ncbi:unnamed protein product [Cylicostephanus goldi]|uniref:Uncharacterized protein n=1 Tax=Cylicostephanus goldi TaxID=71465 RepID=A0A3P7LZS6_CYLGO|nr:unnamed protein product [Cylicostephanus goldi]
MSRFSGRLSDWTKTIRLPGRHTMETAPCPYNAGTVSANAGFLALRALRAYQVHRLRFAGNEVQEEGPRQMGDRTLIIRGEKVLSRKVGGSVVHPSILSTPRDPIISTKHPTTTTCQKTISIIKCDPPTPAANEDAFYLEIVCNEKSFHKFAVGDFNAKVEMPL